MARAPAFDYLAIGHVTCDLVRGISTIGGTVSYAARTATALGCRVGVVTSASADLDLEQVFTQAVVARLPAATTTTFQNFYTANGREQVLHSIARPLFREAVPPDWQAAVVHLGPVARECDPSLTGAFGEAFVGVTPQGWMRQWDQRGRVRTSRWIEADAVLARADAVVLSEDDIAGNAALAATYAAKTKVLVVTRGAAGCTVYSDGVSRDFASPKVCEVDPTGAGDVFAAVFFADLQRHRDPWQAARFANCVAAQSVTRAGLLGTPDASKVARCVPHDAAG